MPGRKEDTQRTSLNSTQTARVSVKMDKFFTPEGEHTCAINFEDDGLVCQFYRTTKLGGLEVCAADPEGGKYANILSRADKGVGYLIPGSWCPLKCAE